jgi:inosine/xanthosine triphosphate pyrophosphatase family protein
MKEIIYGTTNPAKVKQVRDILAPLGFTVKSLVDFDNKIAVDEDGRTAEENAQKKALAYAQELNEAVLSMDVALYIDGLPDEQQPGLHVRRIDGNERATDQELIKHYSELVGGLGGRVNAYWRYAFALGWPTGKCVSFVHDSPRIFVSQPSKKVVEGFPTESLLLDPESGKYISELSTDEMAKFWQITVGEPLVKFVKENY